MSVPVPAVEVRTLPIDQLKPAPYNPRTVLKPGSPAYRKLKASLTEFGLVEPLIWNEHTGNVVGGHARLRILKELGVTEVPVSVVRLTDAREKALNVMLNNAEAQAKYDTAKLADLLAELEPLPELELTGFDARTLTALELTPLPELPPVADSGRVEVTLVADVEVYARLADRLDALVREFDLTTHVRRG